MAATASILPNVIVPGTQKGGTTALCSFLDQHPECLVSSPKEPNFFSRAANLADMAALHRCFARARPGQHLFIDGTTTYMADPAIAPRIRNALGPDARIVVTLRSPAKRTYSGYLHMLKRGHERRSIAQAFGTLPDDPDAAAEAERAALEGAVRHRGVVVWPYRRQYDDVLWNFRYVGNSQYRRQVEGFERAFGADRVLVLLFEDMVADMAPVASELARFLGISAAGFPASLPRENVTRIPDTRSIGGRLIEQARRIKRGNFVLVRADGAKAPLKAPPDLLAKLRRIHADETAYWSKRLARDLGALGW